MSAIVNSVMRVFAKQYQGVVASRCAAMGKEQQYNVDSIYHLCKIFFLPLLLFKNIYFPPEGLKYEDLLIENDDVMKALSRTLPAERIER
jgi:hypothetical protein